MEVSVKQTGAWQRTLEVEVPAGEVDRSFEEAAQQVQRRARLAGFRPGKVPIDLVRQHFAEAIEQQLFDGYVPRVAQDAVARANLDPIVPPLVRNVRLTPGAPLTLEVAVEVRPEMEVRDYRGLPVRRQPRVVDDAAVERVLNDLRDDAAVYTDIDRPAERGDVVLLDSTRLDAKQRRLSGTRAKNRRIELGAPGVPPDLENGLLGAVAGQERTLTIRYPDDYPAAELAGKDARYVVKIRKIQAKKLRDLDDNLARDVFHLESLADLRSRVRKNLEDEERARLQREAEHAIAEELIRRHPIELPERLVQWMLDAVITDAAGERGREEPLRQELEKRYRPGVERSLKREFLLDAVARQEHLTVSEDEVAAEIDRLAQADPRHASRLRAQYQSADRRRSLQGSLLERKALEWLTQVAEIQDEAVPRSPLVVPAGG